MSAMAHTLPMTRFTQPTTAQSLGALQTEKG